MATLIPSIGACVSRMTNGERRFAERLEAKLDDDYLMWYDVPMGPRNAHPDFCVMHPRRGILILEVKDWKKETIKEADKQTWTITPDGIPKHVIEPNRVLCKDEIGEAVIAEDLQSRLWDMFAHMMRGVMSLPQLDRVRWIMFSHVRHFHKWCHQQLMAFGQSALSAISAAASPMDSGAMSM